MVLPVLDGLGDLLLRNPVLELRVLDGLGDLLLRNPVLELPVLDGLGDRLLRNPVFQQARQIHEKELLLSTGVAENTREHERTVNLC